MKEYPKYTVVRDTREKEGHGWTFPSSTRCTGTLVQKLDVGDYSLLGFEKLFTIERKGSIMEFCSNLMEKRFMADYNPSKKPNQQSEFVRLEFIKWPFMLLEFTVEDLVKYPHIPVVPPKLRSRIRFTGSVAMKTMIELQMKYKTKIIFCGDRARDVASSIFKRIVEEIEKNVSK